MTRKAEPGYEGARLSLRNGKNLSRYSGICYRKLSSRLRAAARTRSAYNRAWGKAQFHMMVKPQSVTALLRAWEGGDDAAAERLVPLVDAELRQLARRHMARESSGHTLQTTALINEAYLRLVDGPRVRWQNRAHFFALAARLMRHILVDHARAKRNLKRGRGFQRVPLSHALVECPPPGRDLVALDDALHDLAAIDPRRSRVVELRFFGGLTVDETAAVLSMSPETVMRDWKLARVWLRRELQRAERDAT